MEVLSPIVVGQQKVIQTPTAPHQDIIMEINVPEVKRTVIEYDFVFTSGQIMPVTIDPKAGDTISEGDQTIDINLTSKPSMNDPSKLLPSEKVVIYKQYLISVQKREKEILELTPEQKAAWTETFKKMSRSVN